MIEFEADSSLLRGMSMYASLEIVGLRGFADRQRINFVVPNGTLGSGLTILVGANNSGKSTAIEALRALSQDQPPSFTVGRRNKAGGDAIELVLRTTDDLDYKLESIQSGSSETRTEPEGSWGRDLFVLPSRRVFSPYFSKSSSPRHHYMQHIGFPVMRSSSLDQITGRLFSIQSDPSTFNSVMRRVLDPPPKWTIDQDDNGSYFLKFSRDDVVHTSEGLGEGIISLIYIVDALHDASEDQLIAIDEPELSLHPALQRRLAKLLSEYAATRQIVISTHSPYFVDMAALANGGKIARVHVRDSSSKISELSCETSSRLSALLRDRNNPHVLGLNAQEAFFLDDGLILVEGQEDVVHLNMIETSLGIKIEGDLFGWGVGGAEKMEMIAQMLQELGFRSVAGILDGNRQALAIALNARFPEYRFFSIPAEDIRTKAARKAKEPVEGLLDLNGEVRAKYESNTKSIFLSINDYLEGKKAAAE